MTLNVWFKSKFYFLSPVITGLPRAGTLRKKSKKKKSVRFIVVINAEFKGQNRQISHLWPGSIAQISLFWIFFSMFLHKLNQYWMRKKAENLKFLNYIVIIIGIKWPKISLNKIFSDFERFFVISYRYW